MLFRKNFASDPIVDDIGEIGQMDLDALKNLVRRCLETPNDELTCDECLAQVDRYAELTLAGLSADEAMPRVAQHLASCPDCRREFTALLVALQTL